MNFFFCYCVLIIVSLKKLGYYRDGDITDIYIYKHIFDGIALYCLLASF